MVLLLAAAAAAKRFGGAMVEKKQGRESKKKQGLQGLQVFFGYNTAYREKTKKNEKVMQRYRDEKTNNTEHRGAPFYLVGNQKNEFLI